MLFSLCGNDFHAMKEVLVVGLLSGVRVLDVTTVIAAPFAAGLMADFGADVIKIEQPQGGDPFRRLPPAGGARHQEAGGALHGLRHPVLPRADR